MKIPKDEKSMREQEMAIEVVRFVLPPEVALLT
jgi:hypothetical protein